MHMRTLEERINGPEAEPFKPEEAGEYVIGVLEEVSEREGDFGPYKVITLYNEETNELHNIAGFGTVLGKKLAPITDADIGRKIAVRFLGEKTGKTGKDYKDWSVAVERTAQPVAAGNFDASDDI